METAVSIPDELFARADALAARTGKSRSQLYRGALAEYVARSEPGAVTKALNEVADEITSDPGRFAETAGHLTLERSEW